MSDGPSGPAVHNPYAPPQSVVADRDAVPDMVPAGKWIRFLGFFIDYLCYMGISFVFGLILALTAGAQAAQGALAGAGQFFFGLAIYLCFYLFFEGIWQRTPGKFLFGTRLVSQDGQPIPFPRLLGRTFARLIPFEAFSFFGRRGWHDSLSGTMVVKVKKT